MEEAEAKTSAVINKLARWIKMNTGICVFPDRNGNYGFFSNISKFGLELGGAEFQSAVGTLLGTVNAGINAAAQIYQNYQNTVDQLQSIQDCFEQLDEFLNNSGGEGRGRRDLTNPTVYQNAVEGENAFSQEQLRVAQEFQAKALNVLSVIDGVLAERELDPDLEPELADLEIEPTPTESVFRLQAGPPEATSGRFILSVDGLYYDTSEGLMPALMEIANKKKDIAREKHWKLDFDPNLGGRGNQLSSENVKFYFNSILDPKIIDDSNALQKFYTVDQVLQNIVGQRDRKVFDVSSQISQMVADGDAQILIDNMKQTLISEAAYYTEKENKRKKQIELAVKIPVLYGAGPVYDPGQIPVNDFSYLEGSNFLMDVKEQRELVITQDDVEGVVLPLEVKYTQKVEANDPVVVDHLLLAGIARGAIIDHDAPSSTAPILPITAKVVEGQLIALYNVLSAKESTRTSEDFGLFNSSEYGADYNAKIVGDASSIFKNGLGTAFLEGVSSNSYIRLPAVRELQDLLYCSEGATFEAWIQVSGLNTNSNYNQLGSSGLHRVILANENTGIAAGASSQPDIEVMSLDEGNNFVRGMVMGFTRDRRFTSDEAASNVDSDNPASESVFLIAPTQSFDADQVGFINQEPCNDDNTKWHGLKIPVSSITDEVAFSDCGSTFSHLAVTFNPSQDKVSVYLDSKLLGASGYYDTFGTKASITPKLPSLKLSNSHASGLELDKFFTPWVLGSGFTDELPNGFMGTVNGGKTSALQGKLGGIKFYSRPLSAGEVLQNYNANKNFFKFVKLI
tara:strand:+ start:4106 stop:6490 length:2385 start_codon:yes stop_codon:yes gene_type:complete